MRQVVGKTTNCFGKSGFGEVFVIQSCILWVNEPNCLQYDVPKALKKKRQQSLS